MKPKLISQVRGLILWIALVCLSTSCSDSPAHLVEIDGWMGAVTFSQDGRSLFGLYARFTEGIGIKSDTICMHNIGNWDKIMEYQSPGRISQIFTCADTDIVLHGEDKDPEGEDLNLIFRSI